MRRPWIIFALAVVGCDGQDTSGPTGQSPAGFTVTVAPAEVSLASGGSATVGVAISRQAGFAGSVSLALVGGPAALSGSFAPNPAPGDQATLTLNATALSPGKYGVYVKGTSGSLKDASALAVTVLPDATIQVTGRVVDLFRQPMAGLEVRLGGFTSVTDAAGRFSFAGVSPPYDLVVKRPSPAEEAHVFRGLTRPDPTLPLLLATPAPALMAAVSGSLSGGDGFPQKAGVVSALFFASGEGFGGVYLFPGQGPAYGPFTASWYGDVTETGTLYGLQWKTDGQLLPQQFLGFASAPLAVQAGVASPGQNLALQPAATGFLSGTIAPPAGFTVARKELWLNAGPFTGVFLGSDATSGAIFTYATPDVGLPIGLQVVATRGAKSTASYRANLLPSEVIAVDLAQPPLLQSPPSGASGVTTATTFSWTAYPDSIHVAIFVSSSGADFVLYQAGTSATLPDLSGFGLPLPPGTSYSWAVWGLGQFADLDAFTAPDRGLGLAGLGEDVLLGMSDALPFTTAP